MSAAMSQKIGRQFVKLRKEKNLTQEAVAFDTCIEKKYMSDIELGKRNISINIIETICNYHRITISDLFKRIEEDDNETI